MGGRRGRAGDLVQPGDLVVAEYGGGREGEPGGEGEGRERERHVDGAMGGRFNWKAMSLGWVVFPA